MKARDIISPRGFATPMLPARNVPADMSVLDLLPRLLDTDERLLGVTDGENYLGVLDETSLLEGLNDFIAARDDSSIITLESSPSSYSASQIAHAVEDADVHLVDLWTHPGSGERLNVTLRVRTTDPSAVVANLERYGYNVTDAYGEENRNLDTALERLLSLKTLLNV